MVKFEFPDPLIEVGFNNEQAKLLNEVFALMNKKDQDLKVAMVESFSVVASIREIFDKKIKNIIRTNFVFLMILIISNWIFDIGEVAQITILLVMLILSLYEYHRALKSRLRDTEDAMQKVVEWMG